MGELRFQTGTMIRPHTHAPQVLMGSKVSGTSMAIRVSGQFDQSTPLVVCLGFEIRTQIRPHAHAPQVLRGSKGSGTSMAIRVSGPFDQSTRAPLEKYYTNQASLITLPKL